MTHPLEQAPIRLANLQIWVGGHARARRVDPTATRASDPPGASGSRPGGAVGGRPESAGGRRARKEAAATWPPLRGSAQGPVHGAKVARRACWAGCAGTAWGPMTSGRFARYTEGEAPRGHGGTHRRPRRVGRPKGPPRRKGSPSVDAIGPCDADRSLTPGRRPGAGPTTRGETALTQHGNRARACGSGRGEHVSCCWMGSTKGKTAKLRSARSKRPSFAIRSKARFY